MTTLAEHIDALRLKMLETAEEEQHLVDALAQRIAEADGKVLAALREIVADQERNRREIAGLITTLAGRVGHLPRAAEPPPLPQRADGPAPIALGGGMH